MVTYAKQPKYQISNTTYGLKMISIQKGIHSGTTLKSLIEESHLLQKRRHIE